MNDSDLHLVTRTILPLLRGMCHKPDELKVTEANCNDGEHSLIVLIDPATCDVGVLNGKAGRTLNGIRGVIAAGFKRFGVNATARIEESYRGELRCGPPINTPDFDKSGFDGIFAQVINIVFPVVPNILRTDDLIDRKDGKTYTRIVIAGHPSLVNSVADAFYPFGIRQGRKLKIVTHNTPTTHESNSTARTREIPR